jgi:nicotinate-nucleotide adenylyltransferase
MKNVALFFGSYNPCHNTHIKIADSISKLDYIDEVQLVVSPQNPFKHDLANYVDRFNICKISVESYDNITVNNIESHLTLPSYTINALNVLSNSNIDIKYYMIMGLDIFLEINKWKSYEIICEKYPFLVLPRDFDIEINKKCFEYKKNELLNNNVIINKDTVFLENFKISSLSSTKIRNCIANSENISIFVPENVEKYIQQNNLYK